MEPELRWKAAALLAAFLALGAGFAMVFADQPGVRDAPLALSAEPCEAAVSPPEAPLPCEAAAPP